MQSKFPQDVYRMYEFILKFTEEKEALTEQLNLKEEEMWKKINAFMDSVRITAPEEGAAELAREALEGGRDGPEPPESELELW